MKNYHTHTPRCQHARGSEEEYIQAAIKNGFTVLGFSDHTPWHYESGFVPSMRMREDQLEDYVNTINTLKEKYKDQIDIRLGLEVEYSRKHLPWLLEQVKKYHIEYMILGHHFDESDETGVYYGYPCSHENVKKYVSQVEEAIETGLFSYVAHPDVCQFTDSSEEDLKEMEKICIKAKEYNIPLEFNLLGMSTNRHYPNEKFLKLCKKHGNKIILGVDAHDIFQLEDIKSYQRGLNYVQSLGLEVVDEIQYLR